MRGQDFRRLCVVSCVEEDERLHLWAVKNEPTHGVACWTRRGTC